MLALMISLPPFRSQQNISSSECFSFEGKKKSTKVFSNPLVFLCNLSKLRSFLWHGKLILDLTTRRPPREARVV